MKAMYPVILALVLFLSSIATIDAQPSQFENFSEPLPDQATLRRWVSDMKKSSRGPFKHIRWFCADGSLQQPKEYACKEHGGGVQHGEWIDQVKRLRAGGYFIATVFADIEPDFFLTDILFCSRYLNMSALHIFYISPTRSLPPVI